MRQITSASIKCYYSGNGILNFEVIEGNRKDNLLINTASNTLTLNGNKIALSKKVYIEPQPQGNSSITSTVWVYQSTEQIDIVSAEAFRNLTKTLTLMLLGSVLGYLGGLAVGGADAFWNYFQNKDKDINTAYVFRSTFLEENYWAYKYTDAYYENQNKTGLIQITSREWWV